MSFTVTERGKEGRGHGGGEERHTERESKEWEKSVTGNDDGAVCWEQAREEVGGSEKETETVREENQQKTEQSYGQN